MERVILQHAARNLTAKPGGFLLRAHASHPDFKKRTKEIQFDGWPLKKLQTPHRLKLHPELLKSEATQL